MNKLAEDRIHAKIQQPHIGSGKSFARCWSRRGGRRALQCQEVRWDRLSPDSHIGSRNQIKSPPGDRLAGFFVGSADRPNAALLQICSSAARQRLNAAALVWSGRPADGQLGKKDMASLTKRGSTDTVRIRRKGYRHLYDERTIGPL
ncbi:hypothetical protein [Ferrovibrio xuzhouensis]|uniref:Uncharacterized protein n=1 Tax=Ferrovibrio xuzhouensis TaxID=1576914 RepID=A0ABV7VCQ4_9PROT